MTLVFLMIFKKHVYFYKYIELIFFSVFNFYKKNRYHAYQKGGKNEFHKNL